MAYDTLASWETLNKTADALRERGFEPLIVENGTEALVKIKELIPAGASVMNGASVTLETIGFVDYLKEGKHGWNNLHAAVLAEKDPAKQQLLRRQSVVSDFYLGSVHAVAETGELVIASNSGSQLPHIAYTSPNLIFVVGAQKIAPTLAAAMDRLETYVVPLEEVHMQEKYKVGTVLSKELILRRKGSLDKNRTIRVILVNEKLGF